jgi:type I restriction enzyme S subunit
MIADLNPYPAMKDSGVPWLGEVPKHWEVLKLKYVVTFSGGGTPSKAEASYWRGEIPWVSPKDMTRPRISDSADHITEEAVAASATSIVAPGALLMVVRSGILRRTIPVAINSIAVALNQDMKALRPRANLVRSEYLRLLIQGNQRALIRKWTKHGATVESIEHEYLANSRVPLPTLSEQAAIVSFLDHVDRRIRRYIRAKQKLIKLLEEQKQAIIHRAVTRGLDPDVRFKPSGVEWMGEVPEHWEVRRNGRLFLQRNETGFADLRILEVSLRTGVRIRDFENSDRKQVMADRDKYKRAVVGDIAYNMMRMWQGAIGLAPADGLISPAYVVAKPLAATNSRYFVRLFRTAAYMAEVDKFSRGIVKDRNRLYWDDFKQMPSYYPPPREQEMIADAIDDKCDEIDDSTGRARREVDLLREYRTRLIADVVTGKLDVREAAARLPGEADPREDAEPIEDAEEPFGSEADEAQEEPEGAEA